MSKENGSDGEKEEAGPRLKGNKWASLTLEVAVMSMQRAYVKGTEMVAGKQR
jgi:hypothetical protein